MSEAPIKYVNYFRVSTKGQGDSGLGLGAQKRDIDIFLESYSDKPYEVIAEFTDVVSGSKNDRPELSKAIALAKKEKAILLVAKLDRLSRKVSFIANILDDKKLQLKVAIMPNADKFQLHIYAALAEQERDFISKRTKAALQIAKARGVKLGGNRPNSIAANRAKRMQADNKAEKLRTIITPMVVAEMTLQHIANSLNSAGLSTDRGNEYKATTVNRVISRLNITRG
jgi:DNA invertase Pin-like site-specific DNA recombinase